MATVDFIPVEEDSIVEEKDETKIDDLDKDDDLASDLINNEFYSLSRLHTMTHMVPTMPWKTWHEFECVYKSLYGAFDTLIEKEIKYDNSNDRSTNRLSIEMTFSLIEVWRSRQPKFLPVCVDVTYQILKQLIEMNSHQDKNSNNNNNNNNINRQTIICNLGMNISRLTNRLTDPMANRSDNTMKWVETLQFPSMCVFRYPCTKILAHLFCFVFQFF